MNTHSLQDVRTILEQHQTIAVLGVSASPEKPAHYVPEYMVAHGYKVIPVNASMTGQTMFDQPIRASLSEITEPVDVVDMFRRSEYLEDHLEDILGMKPLPKVVWLQLGIRNDLFAQRLEQAGIEVVQDRCIMADHHNLRL